MPEHTIKAPPSPNGNEAQVHADINRIARAGVDIRVAAGAAMKRAAYESPRTEAASAPGVEARGTLHRRARSLAKRLFTALRPVLRPIASRVRNYMNQPLQEQMARIEQQLGHRGSGGQPLEHQLAALERSVATLAQVTAGSLGAQLARIEQYALASARRVAVSCGPSEVMVRTEVGFVLCPSSDHAVIGALLETGELEPGTRLLIQRVLKSGDVFVDIGANLGMHTLAAAHAMRGQGKVIAFEPYEPTFRLLAKTVWMNGFSESVQVRQAAVSSRSGTQELFVGQTSGHNSLFRLEGQSADAGGSVQVPVVGLDDQIPPGTRVDLIKIDVEGAELDVLASASRVIRDNPAVGLIAEFGRSHLRRIGQSTQDWLAAFEALGLTYRAVDPQSGELRPCSIPELEAVDSVNLLFARPGAAIWAMAGTAA